MLKTASYRPSQWCRLERLVFHTRVIAMELADEVWSEWQTAPLRMCLFKLGNLHQGLWCKLSELWSPLICCVDSTADEAGWPVSTAGAIVW